MMIRKLILTALLVFVATSTNLDITVDSNIKYRRVHVNYDTMITFLAPGASESRSGFTTDYSIEGTTNIVKFEPARSTVSPFGRTVKPNILVVSDIQDQALFIFNYISPATGYTFQVGIKVIVDEYDPDQERFLN